MGDFTGKLSNNFAHALAGLVKEVTLNGVASK